MNHLDRSTLTVTSRLQDDEVVALGARAGTNNDGVRMFFRTLRPDAGRHAEARLTEYKLTRDDAAKLMRDLAASLGLEAPS
jgi:hypothetical protein